MKKILLYCLVLLPVISFAQKSTIVSPYYEKLAIKVDSTKNYHLKSRREFTSFLIKTDHLVDFRNSYIITASDTFYLKTDLHNSTDFQNGTELFILKKATDSVRIYTGSVKGNITLHLLNAYTDQINTKSFRILEEENCGEPSVITPEYWRQGLPEPIGTPIETEVNHLIIHHSASDPSVSNVAVMRSIYQLHTEVNKWDDIGYNFVIASDGTIFQGRDDRSLFDKDNVLGAHMCGRNAGTMGICLLGDFTDKLPTQKCLNSLYLLLAWKASKENLDVYGSSLHPIGGYSQPVPDIQLPHIAGHRDGCKAGHTECPGNAFYPYINSIKDSTYNYLKNCPVLSGFPDDNKKPTKVFPQPAIDKIFIQSQKKWVKANLYDLSGSEVGSFRSQGAFLQEFSLEENLFGVYILHIMYEDETLMVNKVVIN